MNTHEPRCNLGRFGAQQSAAIHCKKSLFCADLATLIDMTTVYRVMSRDEWQRAQDEGFFRGAAHDVRDGFIHFSAAEQLTSTLRAHYAGARDLVLLYVKVAAIGAPDAWRWEPSRGGALFPHLYSPLPAAAVHRVEPLALDANGEHVLPALDV